MTIFVRQYIMSESLKSSLEIGKYSSDQNSYQAYTNYAPDHQVENKTTPSKRQKTHARSDAISLIRARTLVRMSPVSSAENSPVKSESSERSPGVSPKRSPGRSPVQQPSGGSPRKSPKKPQDNSPRKSPGSFRTTTARHNEQSSALNGQPVQLFQNPVPVLEPFALPNGKNEKNKKQEAPSGEQSPASAKSEPIYTTPYMLSSQYRTDQAFATPSQVYPSMLVPYVDTSLMQNSSTLQFGPVLAPPNHDRHSNLTSFELEWGKVPEMDQAQTLSTWESPETTAAQHVTANEGDLTTLTTPLALRAASSPENGTNGLNKAHGAQSFPPSSSARRNTTTAKTILFPIQELSHANSVTPNLPILTPGSSFTLDSQGSQTTPSTAEPSSPARSQIFSNGSARPSSSLSTQSSPSTRAGVLTQKPEGFFWQLDSHGFPCAASGCDQRCNLWDGTTVICPKCGPYSEIRYCSKDHLLEDVKWHWLYCGQATFEHPCRENSIPQEVRDGVPLIPCIHPYDTPERHRQAVYFNVCAGEGDYFIFADWVDMLEPKVMDNNQALRCSSHVVHVVTFDDPVEKDRFRRVLATCLFMTIEVPSLVDYMYHLIRDNLQTKSTWTTDLSQALNHQLTQELSVQIQPHITGERHACPTDWDGRNRRACKDTVCREEYRRLLGSLGGMGHRRLVDHLEAGYWILRAARSTHPEVGRAEARMQGEGFEGVLDEDRKRFCRGSGWDGARSGCLEIEGVNV